MAKKYYKKEEKDLLEEIIKRNRNRLKSSFNNVNQNIRKAKNKTINFKEKTYTNKTIFKSIGHRKSSKSLGFTLNYILNNVASMENEIGEMITKDNLSQEEERFDLIKDKENLKNNKKPLFNDENLKRRQVWHCVFSLPYKKDKKDFQELFKTAISKTLEEEFVGYKYIFGIHENTKHPHAHIVIKEKNDLTKKQLRITTSDLFLLNQKFKEKCIELDILNKDVIKNEITNENQPIVIKKKKLPDFYYQKAPKWVECYEKNDFPKLIVNESTLNRLKQLGMDDANINSFLNLYQENKALAIGALNNNARLFNIATPKESFTLRKTILSSIIDNTNEINGNTDIPIKKHQLETLEK
jgi:hypothetical protein